MSEKNESPTGTKPRLSCPFCGSASLFTEPDEWGSGGQWVSPIHVGCKECKAEQSADTEEEAVKRWNRRSSPAPSAPGDAQDERSPTHGMTLGERIAHVGGRTNAQGYTEFGSPMAVNALIQHVLRDMEWTRQDDDGAYQARYRLPGGQWSTWGHVVCGVKGHEQELRYLPGERRPAPAAGDALDSKRLKWIAQNAWALRDLDNGRKNSLVWQQPRTVTEGALNRLRAAIDAALAAQVPQQGEA